MEGKNKNQLFMIPVPHTSWPPLESQQVSQVNDINSVGPTLHYQITQLMMGYIY